MTISFFLPISTVKLFITGHKATGSNWLNSIVVNQCLHLFTRVYASTTCSIKSYFNLYTNSESFRFMCKHFLYVYYNMFKILLAIYSCLRSHSYTSCKRPPSSIYRPPSALVDSFAAIEQLVKQIDDENKEFYLLGDLNANMLDISNNATKNLISIMEQYQLTQTINTPTRKTMNSSSLLDVCLTPTPEKLITSRVVPITLSDHYMIVVVRKINNHSKRKCHKKVEFRNLKHFNVENFQADLRSQEWELLDNQSCVDKMCEIWKTQQFSTNMPQLEKKE